MNVSASSFLSTFIDKPVPLLQQPDTNAHLYQDHKVVVCGRGKGAYNRPGNKSFRSLIRNYLQAYMTATSKFQKGDILHRIVDDVREQELVFVKKTSNGWTRISEKEMKDKIGHAVREAVAQEHRNQKEITNGTHGSCSIGSSGDMSASANSSSSNHHQFPSDLDERRSHFDRMLERFRQGQVQSQVLAVSNDPVVGPDVDPLIGSFAHVSSHAAV